MPIAEVFLLHFDDVGVGSIIRSQESNLSNMLAFHAADVGLVNTFIADVFDGYGRFRDQETLVNKEEGVTDTQLLLRILGYQYDREGGTKEVHDDAVEADELRFRRTPDAISTQSTEAGLPIVAPATEGPYSPSNG
ncbi:uncharacterized protein GLRG_10231 [Colletotrichum graminicola M1.001]|uniref:Uncharacterized protein n=1 Tax=Colletotrichum graminicola (strain M1.001 / M2 / FGSC 10212) TaxID=645133 RepID=E3QW49_COLGM|nr:uncharacterized protein GLRG_10231 [Colletotrichum graminicola M1.001]EFQ35087.1 hypothetical protein GLRG_10231 [Colletotrichum graminicola M1.001]